MKLSLQLCVSSCESLGDERLHCVCHDPRGAVNGCSVSSWWAETDLESLFGAAGLVEVVGHAFGDLVVISSSMIHFYCEPKTLPAQKWQLERFVVLEQNRSGWDLE